MVQIAQIIQITLSAIATIIILFAVFYRIVFLRNPKRNTPIKGIVSPANGKVARVLTVGDSNVEIKKGMLGKINLQTKDTIKKGYLINIVMNPLNVHYQRSPADGKVLNIKYNKGKLHNAVLGARNMRAALENENNEILLETKKGRIKIIQIAGLVANRIECFARKNQNIKKGQTIGIIKLGSQVSVILPDSFGIKVKEGDYVVDGETVIAE